MTEPSAQVFRKLRWPLRLTRAGLLAEQVLRAFWPLISVLLAGLALAMLGAQDHAPVELVWGGAVLLALALLASLGFGLRRFRWPRRAEALARLDASLPGRPIQALLDAQAIGAGDIGSAAVWQAHQMRMAARAGTARAPAPDLRIARLDPFALRYAALLAFLVALIFGSVSRIGSIAEMGPGAGAATLAGGPAWEGWVEPPRHTGRPALYLGDIDAPGLDVPVGSRITLRFYGEIGALTLSETVSGGPASCPRPRTRRRSSPSRARARCASRAPAGAAGR